MLFVMVVVEELRSYHATKRIVDGDAMIRCSCVAWDADDAIDDTSERTHEQMTDDALLDDERETRRGDVNDDASDVW